MPFLDGDTSVWSTRAASWPAGRQRPRRDTFARWRKLKQLDHRLQPFFLALRPTHRRTRKCGRLLRVGKRFSKIRGDEIGADGGSHRSLGDLIDPITNRQGEDPRPRHQVLQARRPVPDGYGARLLFHLLSGGRTRSRVCASPRRNGRRSPGHGGAAVSSASRAHGAPERHRGKNGGIGVALETANVRRSLVFERRSEGTRSRLMRRGSARDCRSRIRGIKMRVRAPR